MKTENPKKIAVIGGAGALGGGLAYRWAKAGHHVIIGSREATKAQAAAEALRERVSGATVDGADYRGSAEQADMVVVAVPFSAQRDALEVIKPVSTGKVVIDTTVSLKPPKVGTVQLPPEGSAGMIAAAVLGPDVTLVSAFQNVAADLLATDEEIDCDILVCGNDAAACAFVCGLAADAGLTAHHAGPIENSAATEALTSLLISLNRRYKGSHAGIRITGLVHPAT